MFYAAREARDAVRWEATINELRAKKLLQDRDHPGEVYTLTEQGYRLAELLQEEQLVAQ